MIEIVPSILSADLARLGDQVLEAQQAGANGLQIDIMDGHFVRNLTFGSGTVKAIRRIASIRLDIHLMVAEPGELLESFCEAGADCLIVHQEACLHLHRIMLQIRGLGLKAGVAINPGTPCQTLEEVLYLADVLQIMTVNPGFGGQSFIRSQLEKILRLRRMLRERGMDTPIIVDGGIDPATAPLAVNAGATVLVAGSSIYNWEASVSHNIDVLRASIATP